jgi:membrane-associated phospholipid phosphatase
LGRARTGESYYLRNAKPAWICALLALLSLAAAAVLAVVVENLTTGGRLVVWDSEIQNTFPTPRPSTVTTFFEAVTWAGNAFVLVGLVTLAGVCFLRRKRLASAALILTGAFAAEAIAVALKVALHDLHPHSHAFPSGHTAGSAATYGILFYLATRRRSPALRVGAALAFVGLVTLIAFSRLYLHVHYLSDVLAGTALGVAVGAACLCMYEWSERHRTRTSSQYGGEVSNS